MKGNFKKLSKRTLALVLSLVMCLGMLPGVAYAEETEEPFDPIVSNGKEETAKESKGRVTHSKIIAETDEENVFQVTLTVNTKEEIVHKEISQNAAVILVLDTSGSMGDSMGRLSWDWKGQHHDGSGLKGAAEKFVENFIKDAGDGVRKIAIVDFSSNASSQGWKDAKPGQDDTDAAINPDVRDIIFRLTSGGGTNIEAGLMLARNLLDSTDVAEITNRYVVLMTDGEPTFYVDGNNPSKRYIQGIEGGSRKSNHTDYHDIWCDQAGEHGGAEYNHGANLPKQIKDKGATLYTVSFKDPGGKVSGLTVSQWLAKFADQSVDAGTDIFTALGSIGTIIANQAKAWKLTDPMGSDYIKFEGNDTIPTVTNKTQNETQVAQFNTETNTLIWNLKNDTHVKHEGEWYTYTLTYKVRLDTDAEGFDETKHYDVNGITTLTYMLSEDGVLKEDLYDTELTFPVIQGKKPQASYTVNKASKITHQTTGDGACPADETDIAHVGDTIAYTLTVTNTGKSNLTRDSRTVTVEDDQLKKEEFSEHVTMGTLPDGVTYSNGVFTISKGLAKQNEKVTITYDYTVQDADKGTTVKNVAVGKDKAFTPDDKDNENEVPVEKLHINGIQKDIVTETAWPDGVERKGYIIPENANDSISFYSNETITLLYKIAVTGDAGAKYKVTDTGATWVSGEGRQGTDGTITGEIPDGGSAVIYVSKTFSSGDTGNLTAGAGADSGKLFAVNTAKVESSDPDTTDVPDGPKESDVKTPVDVTDPVSAFTITKTAAVNHRTGICPDGETAAHVGDTITYTVAVRNTGDVELVDIVIQDTLSNITLDTSESTAGVTQVTNGFKIARLAKDGVATIVYTYMVRSSDKGSTIVNVATSDSTGTPTPKPDPDPDPDEPNVTETEVEKLAIIGITKTLDENQTPVKFLDEGGVTLRYTLTVVGDAGAKFAITDEGAVLVDAEGVAELSAVNAGETVTRKDIHQEVQGGVITGTIGGNHGDANQQAVVHVYKTFYAKDIKKGANGNSYVENIAVVNSGDPDTTKAPENNKSSVETPVTPPETPASGTVSGVDKRVVTSAGELTRVNVTDPDGNRVTSLDGITYPSADGKVYAKAGDTVTLLYAIELTGEPGDTFDLTEEEGTSYVGSTLASYAVIGYDSEMQTHYQGELTGYSAILYFTKTFTVTADADGKLQSLTNKVEVKDLPPATETVEVSEVPSYTVNYKDVATNADIANAKVVSENVKVGNHVYSANEQKVIEGYTFSHAAPLDIVIDADSSKNVITIYYTKNPDEPVQVGYVINYYKDSIAVENQLGSSITGIGNVGDDIFYALPGQLAPIQGQGYGFDGITVKDYAGNDIPGDPTVLVRTWKLVADEGKVGLNTINIVYTKPAEPAEPAQYTVVYWQDAAESGTRLGDCTVTVETMPAEVTLAAGTASGQLDYMRNRVPSGYSSGTQVNKTPGPDKTINVVYAKTTHKVSYVWYGLPESAEAQYELPLAYECAPGTPYKVDNTYPGKRISVPGANGGHDDYQFVGWMTTPVGSPETNSKDHLQTAVNAMNSETGTATTGSITYTRALNGTMDTSDVVFYGVWAKTSTSTTPTDPENPDTPVDPQPMQKMFVYDVVYHTQSLDAPLSYAVESSQRITVSVPTDITDPANTTGPVVYESDYSGREIRGFTYNHAEFANFGTGNTVKKLEVQTGTDGRPVPVISTLHLYYNRNVVDYTVRYLERGTNRELANGKVGSGLFGGKVEETAIPISGYVLAGPDKQSILSLALSGNVITFFYKEDKLIDDNIKAEKAPVTINGGPWFTGMKAVYGDTITWEIRVHNFSDETYDLTVSDLLSGTVITNIQASAPLVPLQPSEETSVNPAVLTEQLTPASSPVIPDTFEPSEVTGNSENLGDSEDLEAENGEQLQVTIEELANAPGGMGASTSFTLYPDGEAVITVAYTVGADDIDGVTNRITISGTRKDGTPITPEDITSPTVEVDTVNVSYVVTGSVPAGYRRPEGTTLVKGSPYSVAEAPASVTNTDGYIDTIYTFGGWSENGTITVNTDTEIRGEWRMRIDDRTPSTYPVTYTVTGQVPPGYPTSWSADRVTAGGYHTVQPAPGNVPGTLNGVTGTYVFSGWTWNGTTPGTQIQVNDSVEITGSWTFVEDTPYIPPYIPPVTPPVTIPDPATPLGPTPDDGTTIIDEDVPLAGAIGLNDTDHFAYIIGYDDDTVKPLNNITRAEVATIFFRLMTETYRITNWSTENSFTDVKSGDWFNNAISTCANAGALKGYTDGSFKPNASITRAEFAAIAARFLSDEYTDEDVGDFSDTGNHWAAADIRRAVKAGWIKGDGNKFNPDKPITRAEVMTMVNRMLDRIPDADHMLPTMKKWIDNPEGTWYYEAVQEATNEHDYERDELGVVETWTELLTVRDWKALEAEWAANGGASASQPDTQPDTQPAEGAEAPEGSENAENADGETA